MNNEVRKDSPIDGYSLEKTFSVLVSLVKILQDSERYQIILHTKTVSKRIYDLIECTLFFNKTEQTL